MSTKQVTISEAQKVAAEEQISKLRKEIDYNTRDYTIDFLIQQFRSDEFYTSSSVHDIKKSINGPLKLPLQQKKWRWMPDFSTQSQ